jgi:Polyketide cyclase / dehydrase and lipid transport
MTREGTGETTALAEPEAAFTFLADPRNAQRWFAGAALAEQLESAPHTGMCWRFVQARNNRLVPVRMEVYEPPLRFVWRTTLRWPRTNLRWEMRCDPDEQGERQNRTSTRLRMTIRIEPGPVGWLGLVLSPRLYRPDPALQAQRAVERARDALEDRATAHTTERTPTGKSPEKRGRRRR